MAISRASRWRDVLETGVFTSHRSAAVLRHRWRQDYLIAVLLLAAVGILLWVPLTYIFHVTTSDSYIPILLLFCLSAELLAFTEPVEDRLIFLNLFAWAFLLRLAALLALSVTAAAAGGPFLGPDSKTYLWVSQQLAADGFSLPEHPTACFGTYDVAHYYVFGSLIRFFQADLFSLQLFNSGLMALVAPLSFSWCRILAPRYAVALGIVVAAYPSLIVLSAVDLLKDPSVLFATTLAIWVFARLARRGSGPSLAGLVLTGGVALSYLHTSRFYVVMYLELALVATAALTAFRRYSVVPSRAALAAAFLIVVAGESAPAYLGWPSSPSLMVAQVEYTLGTPGMRSYSVGLVDRLRPDQERGTVTWLANVFRRVFGPFIWIMPSRWDLRTMLTSDYLLYPGMLIWYAMLPLMVLGVIVTGSRVWSAEERQWTLILVWIFLALYFAQYLAINLAYRQRDLMLPFLMLFGFMGLARAIEYRGWTRAYGAYWVALGTVAGGHLLVRALLQTR